MHSFIVTHLLAKTEVQLKWAFICLLDSLHLQSVCKHEKWAYLAEQSL